jgi:hypothetical protein
MWEHSCCPVSSRLRLSSFLFTTHKVMQSTKMTKDTVRCLACTSLFYSLPALCSFIINMPNDCRASDPCSCKGKKLTFGKLIFQVFELLLATSSILHQIGDTDVCTILLLSSSTHNECFDAAMVSIK